MTRYYLGVRVEVLERPPTGVRYCPDGWVWARWPDGREFLHWRDQLREEPWG